MNVHSKIQSDLKLSMKSDRRQMALVKKVFLCLLFCFNSEDKSYIRMSGGLEGSFDMIYLLVLIRILYLSRAVVSL